MKKNSKIYKTKLLTDDRGDLGFYTTDEKPRPLPAMLASPLEFNVADQLNKQNRAKKDGKIASLRLDATTEAMLVENFSERWRRLHKHYKSDGSPEGWQKLAVSLAREFIPGLSIEYIYPTERAAAHDLRARSLLLYVAEKLRYLRGQKMASGEKGAIKAVYRKWPEELGRQPKTAAALIPEYYRAKARVSELLGHSAEELGLPTTKRPRRKS